MPGSVATPWEAPRGVVRFLGRALGLVPAALRFGAGLAVFLGYGLTVALVGWWCGPRRLFRYSQRMLRDKAEEAFITEIGAALELSPEDAQEKVGGILASRIDRE